MQDRIKQHIMQYEKDIDRLEAKKGLMLQNNSPFIAQDIQRVNKQINAIQKKIRDLQRTLVYL